MRLGTEQRAAAAIAGGPVRVVAGAGTGKTAVIAERFRRLVAGGAAPGSILVMTFTERAAAEMRQRIEDQIGAAAPSVGTFHSVALGWLRADGRTVGVPPGFRILTGADRWIFTRELMWDLGDPAFTADERPDDLVSPALQMLERLKQELVPLQRLSAWASSTDDHDRAELMLACVRLFEAYERRCRTARLLDFEDLLRLAVRMLEQQPAVLTMAKISPNLYVIQSMNSGNVAVMPTNEGVLVVDDKFAVDAPELIECLEIRRANCVTFRVLPALKCQTPRSQLPLLALGALRPTSSGSTHRQDDLAFGVAGLQVGHRLLGLREREDAVDDDFKLFGIDE